MRLNAWLLAPLLVLVGVLVTANYRSSVPERSEWQVVTQHIKGVLQDGDGVTWAPYWASEGRLYLHGLPAFHLPALEDADFARYRRVWLITAFGASPAKLPERYRVAESLEFGALSLHRVEADEPRVVADLLADLDRTRVSLGQQPGKECDFWDGRGWHCRMRLSRPRTEACLKESTAQRLSRHRRRRQPHCGLDRWLNVSRDIRVIGDYPRRCVWFHPRAGKPTRIAWTIPAGSGALVLDYGFTDKVMTDHTRPTTRTAPAKIRVSLSGESVGEVEVAARKGWRRWTKELTVDAEAELVLEASTSSTVDAHLCIDATVRGGAR